MEEVLVPVLIELQSHAALHHRICSCRVTVQQEDPNKTPTKNETENSNSDYKEEIVEQNDRIAKHRMKEYADRKRKAKTSQFQLGDTVLIRQRRLNKLTTRFDPSPFYITRIKGTMITARRRGKYVTRNASHFKKITPNTVVYEDDTLESPEDDETEIDEHPEVSPRIPSQNVRHYPSRNRKTTSHYGQNIYDV